MICLASLISFCFTASVLFSSAVTSDKEIAIGTNAGSIKAKSDNGNTFQLGGIAQYDLDNCKSLYNTGTVGPTNIGYSANESRFRRTRFTAKGSKDENRVYLLTVDIEDDAAEASVDEG